MEDFVDCSWSNDPNPVTIDPELLATASHGIGHDHNGAENDESNDVEGQLLPSWYTGNALAALSNMNALFGNNLTGNLSSSTQPLLGFDNGFDLIQPYPTTGSNDFLPVSSALSISSAAGLLIETFDFSTLQTESTFPSLESVQFELMNPTSTSGIDQISPGTLNPMAFPQWTSSASFSNLGTASWPCDVHHIPALGFCRSDASQLKNIITPPFHDPCPTFLPDVSRTITLPHRCPQPSTNIMAQRNLGMAQDSIPITGFNPACNDSAIVQPSSVCQSQQVVLSPHQIPHSTLHRHHNTTQPTQTTQNPTSTVHADEFAMDNLEELKIIKASGPASRGYNLLPSKRGGKIRKSHSTITTKKPRTIAEKKDVCIRCKWSKLACSGCSDDIACSNCRNIKNPKIWIVPCIKADFMHVVEAGFINIESMPKNGLKFESSLPTVKARRRELTWFSYLERCFSRTRADKFIQLGEWATVFRLIIIIRTLDCVDWVIGQQDKPLEGEPMLWVERLRYVNGALNMSLHMMFGKTPSSSQVWQNPALIWLYRVAVAKQIHFHKHVFDFNDEFSMIQCITMDVDKEIFQNLQEWLFSFNPLLKKSRHAENWFRVEGDKYVVYCMLLCIGMYFDLL